MLFRPYYNVIKIIIIKYISTWVGFEYEIMMYKI